MGLFNKVTKSFTWGNHQVVMETGEVARQSGGAVIVNIEDTVVLATVVARESAKPGQDFFPLTVDYLEKTYAAGKIPGSFFKREGLKLGFEMPHRRCYGVGQVFLPTDPYARAECERLFVEAIQLEDQKFLGWRDVPVNRDMPMSPTVKAMEPMIRQIFIGRGPDVMVTEALERKLYVVRRRSANAIGALKLKHAKEFYMVSCSARTVNYKGLLLADQVGEYYPDLLDKRAVSALSRTLTPMNTTPSGW